MVGSFWTRPREQPELWFTELAVGLLDCWYCWIVGLLECWIVESLACWIVGLLDCWIVGLLDCVLSL